MNMDSKTVNYIPDSPAVLLLFKLTLRIKSEFND